MRNLWRPIEELTNRDSVNLLLAAPELIDLDCNPNGIALGYWQEGPQYMEDERVGVWYAAGFDMCQDVFTTIEVHPTHFIEMEGPL